MRYILSVDNIGAFYFDSKTEALKEYREWKKAISEGRTRADKAELLDTYTDTLIETKKRTAQAKYAKKTVQKIVRFNIEKLADQRRIEKLATLPDGKFTSLVKQMLDNLE